MSPTMYCRRVSKSFHPDSLKSRVSFDLAAASPVFLRNSSEPIGVRPMPRTSNSGFMHPSHARLYRPGISFRLVRSPEAPKITRTHESPVGSRSCDNFSRGLAWIIADINLLSVLYRCSRYRFGIVIGNLLTAVSSTVHLWLQLGGILSHTNDNSTFFEAHFIHERFHQVNATSMNGFCIVGAGRIRYRINVKSPSLV